jgi:hypothetical protein
MSSLALYRIRYTISVSLEWQQITKWKRSSRPPRLTPLRSTCSSVVCIFAENALHEVGSIAHANESFWIDTVRLETVPPRPLPASPPQPSRHNTRASVPGSPHQHALNPWASLRRAVRPLSPASLGRASSSDSTHSSRASSCASSPLSQSPPGSPPPEAEPNSRWDLLRWAVMRRVRASVLTPLPAFAFAPAGGGWRGESESVAGGPASRARADSDASTLWARLRGLVRGGHVTSPRTRGLPSGEHGSASGEGKAGH